MTSGRNQSGTVLLVVLLLSTTMSLLAISLLQTSEISIRARATAFDLERAERAAASGVEWATAWIEAQGSGAHVQNVRLGEGYGARVEIVAGASPNVISEGRVGGVAVVLEADVTRSFPAPGYAFMSFNGSNELDAPFNVIGRAYLGRASEPIKNNSREPMDVDGDLDFVISPTIDPKLIQQRNGAIQYDVSPIAEPVVDTFLFETMPGVTVHRYSGTTQISNVTLDGVVLVTLGGGEELRISNATINGAIVVHPPTGAGGHPHVVIDTCLIQPGPAELGNLAFLGPEIGLELKDSTVQGVVFALEATEAENSVIEGMLLVRDKVKKAKAQLTVNRDGSFIPNVLGGVTWPGLPIMKVDWLGRR